MPRYLGVATCGAILCSVLLASTNSFVSGHLELKEKNNNENKEAAIIHRRFREASGSPVTVEDSQQLNDALRKFERQSQVWFDEVNEFDDFDKKQKNGDDWLEKWDIDDQNRMENEKKHHHKNEERQRLSLFARINLKEAVYKLDREYIFTNGFKLELKGPETGKAVIKAKVGSRHFIFDDFAILKATRNIVFTEGGINKEGFFGGSILFLHRSSGFFENVEFFKNLAGVGGAIFARDIRKLEFIDCKFEANVAVRKGGAVAIDEEDFFNEKKHGHKNRELWNHEKKHEKKVRRVGKVLFDGCEFKKNVADLGGAIWNNGLHTVVKNSKFEENVARLGGAIFNKGRLIVIKSTFIKNVATEAGGAIFNVGKLLIKKSCFSKNTAPRGADILNDGFLRCTIETEPGDCKFPKIQGRGKGYCNREDEDDEPRMIKKVRREKKKSHHNKENMLFGNIFDAKRGEKDEEIYYGYYEEGGPDYYDRFDGEEFHERRRFDEDVDEKFSHGHNKNW